MRKLCPRCGGRGEYLGIGMTMTDCDLCDNGECPTTTTPTPIKNKAPSLDKIDRRSKLYKKTIDDIMKSNPGLSKKEAVALFEEIYTK